MAGSAPDWSPTIFKSYDIRGVYGSELTDAAAYAIGNALVRFLQAESIAVGRDNRVASEPLFSALARGITEAGADIVDLGIVPTPLVYYASAHTEVDGAVVVTASHNPKDWGGFKVCRRDAIAIGSGSGLEDIERMAREDALIANTPGEIRQLDISDAYFNTLVADADFGEQPFTLVIDCANAMGVYELPVYGRFPNLTVIPLLAELDASFPNHEANPHNPANLRDLQERVRQEGADLGIAYDGDADRIGFVDERGEIAPADLVTALIARELLSLEPGAGIVYDLRSSRAVREIIEEHGGRPLESRVGHSHIRRLMREYDARFAGELAQHYYYRETSYAESSTRTAILLLNLMAQTGKTLSELIGEVHRYHHSGEINLEITHKDAVLERLREQYADASLSELDGLKADYPEWWFSVRASNTEPVMRLNVEATTPELLAAKKTELMTLIQEVG